MRRLRDLRRRWRVDNFNCNREKEDKFFAIREKFFLSRYICTVAVVILAFFSPVLLVMSVLLRLLPLGRIAPGATAMTLLLGIARLLRLVMFVRAHDSELSPVNNP